MTKQEWEEIHHYHVCEQNCSWCKHSRRIEKTPWDYKYECSEKEKAKVGKTVKATFCCDLWEHN